MRSFLNNLDSRGYVAIINIILLLLLLLLLLLSCGRTRKHNIKRQNSICVVASLIW